MSRKKSSMCIWVVTSHTELFDQSFFWNSLAFLASHSNGHTVIYISHKVDKRLLPSLWQAKQIPLDPQNNIIPADNKDLMEIISAEANYDRRSNFLFPHGKSPDIYGRRTKQWEAKLPDWRAVKSMIEVIPAQDTKNLQQNPWNWLISPLFGYKTQLLFWSTVSTSVIKVAFFAQKLKKPPQPRVLL
jgi:hypothetical protein